MLDGLLLILTAISLFVFLFYKWGTRYNNFFADRNLSYIKPTFLLGNIGGFLMKQYTTLEFTNFLYYAHPTKNSRYSCTEVMKQLAITDFEYFSDKQSFVNDGDDLFDNTLIMLKGNKWHEMRSTLTPAFTGSKMRLMFDLIVDNSIDLAAHLKKQTSLEFNMRDLFAKLTMDMIANSAFGIKINSFEDTKNKFYVTATEFLNISNPIFVLRMSLLNMLPKKVARFFNIQLFSPEVYKFFSSMVLSNMEVREKEGIFRPDLINLLMNIRKGNGKVSTQQSTEESTLTDGFATVEESKIFRKETNRQWADIEIIAQSFVFFFAGFDSVSNLLSLVAYELAVNPEIQQRLYDETVHTNSVCNNEKLTYDRLQKMKYLDMVMSETLRKWTPIGLTDRLCIKDYAYDDGDVKFTIPKGMNIIIPSISLHYDEKYFTNPTVFDSERFNDENKKNIIPGTYLPFGIGPRSCIGSRLALMEAKGAIYYLIKNFKLVPYEKTQIPLKLAKTPMGMFTEKGVHLKLEPRSD